MGLSTIAKSRNGIVQTPEHILEADFTSFFFTVISRMFPECVIWMGRVREESIVCHDCMTRERLGRHVGLTCVVYRMGEKWEICRSYRCGIQNGRYVGVTGVVNIMGDVREICRSYRCGMQNGRYVGVTGVVNIMGDMWEIGRS